MPTALIVGNAPAANIIMCRPFVNILTFGMCNAKANPTVIAATAAALGTPMPGACLPVIVALWSPASTATDVNGEAAALQSSKCKCAYGGSISVAQTKGAAHRTA